MADMKIAMTLTMADLASPEIQKFKATMAQLEGYLKSLADSFKVVGSGAADFGKVTLDASAGVRQFSRAIGGASRSGGQLGDVLKGLQDQIAGFRAEMASASVTTNDMGTASMRAGAGLEALGAKAAAAKGEMNGLRGTMKGLIELYAGFKIGEGIKKATADAADYQTQKLQLLQRNLPTGQYRAVLGQANQQAALHPWLTKNDALEAQIAALSELPGNTPFMQQMRGYMVPKLQYLARRAGMYGDTSSFFHRIQNSAGLLDAMGAQQNPARASWITRDSGATIAVSGGKDSLQSMETAFRMLHKTVSTIMGQSTFRFFNAGNEEFKAAGGGGSGGNTKMATLINSLVMAASGGIVGKGAAQVLVATGLIPKSAVHPYGHSSTESLVSMGAMLHTNQLLHHTGQFVFKTLVPHFEALVMKRWKERKPGMVNPDTAQGLAQDTSILATYFSKFRGGGGGSTASAIGMFANPEIQRSILAKERQMKAAETNAQSSHGINATAAGQWKIFDTQLHNLAINIGTTLLPALTSLLRVINRLLVGINSFVREFPKATMFATIGTSILGVVLALKGLASLLGMGESFSRMFGLMSASALGADAKIAAGSAATTAEVAASNLRMASTFAITGEGMMATATQLVAGVGKLFLEGFVAFAAGWELWQSIKNFQVAGHTLNAYAGVATMAIAQQFDAMFTYIENGFIRMGGWLDRVGARADAAIGLKGWAAQQSSNAKGAAAAIAANNQAFTFRSHIRQLVAMQDWNAKPSSGEPGAPTGMSPAELLHEENMAALPLVPGGSLNPASAKTLATQAKMGAAQFSAAASIMSKSLALLSAKYSAGLMSVSAYYLARKQIVVTGTDAEIAALGRVEAAYKKAGMASQVKSTQVKIGALQSGLALQLQTIGYQQEGVAKKLAAKLQTQADKIHAAWAVIVNPLGGKIASAQAKYAGISGHLLAGGHMTAAHEAMQVGHHKVLQYQYQGAMQHLAALKGNLHQTLTNTAALVTTGSLTKMQAAQQTIQEQKAAAPAMIQAADAAIRYAKALGDPKLVQALQIQRTHLQAMGAQLGYYAAKVKNITQNSLTGLFQNMMHGQKTWGQMFASFFASIGKSLENTLAQAISQAITKALFTKKTGGAINSIFSLFGSAFTGASGGGSSSAFSGAGILGAGAFSSGGGSSLMSNVGGWIKGITSIASLFGFASGANNIPNDMVANIHKGEMIIPAAGASLIRSGQAGIGGAPGGNHLHLTVHAMDSQSVIGALHSVRAEATQLFLNTAQHLNYNGG